MDVPNTPCSIIRAREGLPSHQHHHEKTHKGCYEFSSIVMRQWGNHRIIYLKKFGAKHWQQNWSRVSSQNMLLVCALIACDDSFNEQLPNWINSDRQKKPVTINVIYCCTLTIINAWFYNKNKKSFFKSNNFFCAPGWMLVGAAHEYTAVMHIVPVCWTLLENAGWATDTRIRHKFFSTSFMHHSFIYTLCWW